MTALRPIGATLFNLLLTGVLLMAISCSTSEADEADRQEDLVITDFTSETTDLGWYVVNDNVMGGRSDGGFETSREGLRFTGRTNTNGGGFSSIRTRAVEMNLSQFMGIRLLVQGDGRRYTWRLTTDARWRGRPVSYWADFETRDGTWSAVDIPYSSFVPRVSGYQLEGPALDPGKITGMGLMIYDEQDGPFDIRLASVRAYATDDPFELTQFRWKKRILVLSAASGEDQILQEQLRELALTPREFEMRDMVLVSLLDGPAASAGDRKLTAAEVSAARAALGIAPESFALRLIGKDGSVKLSRETVTPMADIYALIDTMPMRRQESAGNR
ncbi:MAG: CIA30 family protein [Gammaproteobacteria bacterium]|nr:CIA30 family protein [Gammaproteobacteria bacterium]